MARATAIIVARSEECLEAEIVAAMLRDVLHSTVFITGASATEVPTNEQLTSVDFLIEIYPQGIDWLSEAETRRILNQRGGRSITIVPWQITDEPRMGGWEVETYSAYPGHMVDGLSHAVQSIRQSVLWFQEAQRKKRRIFLSYRRGDTADITGRLKEWVDRVYGDGRAFVDIDNIPLGVNFIDHIQQQIDKCCAVLVIIGQGWLNGGNYGGIQDQTDAVRAEVAAAFSLGVPVVPVFVHGAQMPSAEQLPNDIRRLASISGTSLTAASWREGTERLKVALDTLVKT